jgi:hypothetical protein
LSNALNLRCSAIRGLGPLAVMGIAHSARQQGTATSLGRGKQRGLGIAEPEVFSECLDC